MVGIIHFSFRRDVMTATATILEVWCLRPATGTDAGVNDSLAGLADSLVPEELGGLALADFLKNVPGVISAIDSGRSDPDDLYMTTNTSGGVDSAIWPGGGRTVSMSAEQSQAPQVLVDVDFSQNISLWDRDSISRDDHLGSIKIKEDEQGLGEQIKLAKSDVESSYYYITYRVD
jgi:hypothetical protein